MDRAATAIVGAGVSGLACARALFDAGEPFVVISQNLGGRVLTSADGRVPLGAFYVRADYDHVNQFVTRGRRLRSRDTIRHDDAGAYTRWDARLVAHPVQIVRFLALLVHFRHHYRRFKTNSMAVSQARALDADEFLHRLYHRPATSVVREQRFDDIAHAYLAPGVHGTTFLPLRELTGFSMLLACLPVIEPTYEFEMRWDALLSGFEHNVIDGTVESIVREGDRYRIEMLDGNAWLADHVVVATAPDETQRLLHLPDLNRPVTVHMFEIEGRPRAEWARSGIHLLADDDPTSAIVHRPNAPSLLCSRDRTPDFQRFFHSWTMIEHHEWRSAFNLVGDVVVECEQAPNLYVIGDHNVCGLEDAYITGVHAARRIIEGLGRSAHGRSATEVGQPR